MPAEVRDAMAIMHDIKAKVATTSFGIGSAVDARNLAAVTADEDSVEEDDDDEDEDEDGADGQVEAPDRQSQQDSSSQLQSVADTNVPATQPVPTRPVRTKNSRPSSSGEGGLSNKRRQIGGVLSDLVDNIGTMANSDQQMNRMMMIMMMSCFNQFVDDRRRRDRPRPRYDDSPIRSRYGASMCSNSSASPSLNRRRNDDSYPQGRGALFSPYDDEELDDDY